MPKLARSLNQPVVVSNPAYFGDDEPRRLILVDIEVSGLWFSGEALHARPEGQEALHARPEGQAVAARPEQAVATVFFPFTQIGFLFDPRQLAQLPEAASIADRIVRHPALARAPLAKPELRTDENKRPSRGQRTPKPPKSRR